MASVSASAVLMTSRNNDVQRTAFIIYLHYWIG
jgi:hypothetical protein